MKAEIKVIITALLIVLIGEGIARWVVPTSMHYQVHVNAIPQITRDLHEADAEKKILFVGNSLFWHGLDADLVNEKLGPDTEVTKIAPSGSAILDWNYLIEGHCVLQDQKPDVIVIGGVVHHFDDSEPVKYRPLSRFFMLPSQFPKLAHTDLQTWDERGTAFFSMGSSLIGDQPDIRPFMDDVLAHDGEARTINDLLYEQTYAATEAETTGTGLKPSESFTRLDRLIALLKEHKIEGIFVAMPKVSDWKIARGMRSRLEEANFRLIDARHIEGLGKEQFQEDEYHLNEAGNKMLSEFLIQQISK